MLTLQENNIYRLNSEFTRHQKNCKPSIIDHIYANCKLKMSKVNTIPSIFSDHCMLVTIYTSKYGIYKPKYMRIRNTKLLTKTRLKQYVDQNENLNSIFSLEDPNAVAEIIHIELNSIIESIAPSRIIQCKDNYLPYYDNDIHETISKTNNVLTKAIKSKNNNDWIEFKNLRNTTQKIIKNKKKEYLEGKFGHLKDSWKFIKKFNAVKVQSPPDKIESDNKIITRPKQLAELSNQYFIDKINKIRSTFTWSPLGPIDILSKLIPESESEFIIPEITLTEMKILIKKN